MVAFFVKETHNARALRLLLGIFLLLGTIGAAEGAHTRLPQQPALTMPAAGALITNCATTTFFDPKSGTLNTLDSNTVRAVVQPLEALRLTSDQTAQSVPGTTVTFAHRLTNTGNTPSTYLLSLDNVAGNPFTMANLRIYLDINGNGTIDQGEPVLAAGEAITLNAGEYCDLIVQGSISTNVPAGQTAQLKLTATTEPGQVSAGNIDTIDSESGVTIRLEKTVSNSHPAAGDPEMFTITASSLGKVSPAPVPVWVDGQAASFIVLSDRIPRNTDFVDMPEPAVGQRLFHLTGDDPNHFHSVPPANLAQVDGVAVAMTAFPPGQSIRFVFNVTIHAAANTFENTANLLYSDPLTGATTSVASNTVLVTLPVIPPQIHYFADDTYSNVLGATSTGKSLHLLVNAPSCNLDPDKIDTITITLISSLTGDVEQVVAYETGPNTGIFAVPVDVPTEDASVHPAVHGDGIMETLSNDVITASITDGAGITASTTILIDPYGMVFDSHSGAAIAGARVVLIDVTGGGNGGHPGGQARVFQTDGVTHAPADVRTDADGRYAFPLVAPSTYKLVVTPPTPYAFPSTVVPAMLPTGKTIDPSASYGGTFQVLVGLGAVKVDLPVDPPPIAGLFAEKTVSRDYVEIGDFLVYCVKIRNATGVAVTSASLVDTLPTGFSLVRGSTTLNGTPLTTVTGEAPVITMPLGALIPNQEDTVVYTIHVGPGTVPGTNDNHAIVHGQTAVGSAQSNLASASVRVDRGVFADEGVIFGKVFLGNDLNRVQGVEEIGVPGVRIFLEDGTSAITDSEGKYSFYGIAPGTHVLKVDPLTLPDGAILEETANRFAGDASSCFVDLMAGEMHKVNFLLGPAEDPRMMAAVTARRQCGEIPDCEVDRGLIAPLNADTQPPDTRTIAARPSTGIVGAQSIPNYQNHPVAGTTPSTAQTSVKVVKLQSLDDVLPRLDNTLGFIDLHDGDVLPLAQTNIRVKGMLGARFALRVNGVEVADKQVGTRARLANANVEALEYYGVQLVPGKNTLEIVQSDAFGNERGHQRIMVTAPGPLAVLHVEPIAGPTVADGHSILPVRVKLTDNQGIPVTERTPVTLEASAGHWDMPDLDPHTPGVQVFIDGGSAVFPLVAPEHAGDCLLRVDSGVLETRQTVTFANALRPMLAVGLIDGMLCEHSTHGGPLSSPVDQQIFEQNLQNIVSTGNSTQTSLQGRTAWYMNGRIAPDTLLTMSYDSSKRADDLLFRDIQPNRFYPVYGDSSIKTFDAQSTSPLYLRIDRRQSYFLFGDYTTNGDVSIFDLGAYNRSLTGAKQHLESRTGVLNLYTAHENLQNVVDELPANGTSGPYQLTVSNVLENSEQVEILVRDRNQPAVVLADTPQLLFVDYELEPDTGRLLFKHPIPSLDANFNPVFIRVTYEVNGVGPQFWTSGLNGQYKLTHSVAIGGSLVSERNPQDPYSLCSGNIAVKAGGTLILGEVAQSHRDIEGTGTGERVEIDHDSAHLHARLYDGYTEGRFYNPDSTLGSGRSEAGLQSAWHMTNSTQLVVDGLHSKDVVSGCEQNGVLLNVEHAASSKLHWELGLCRSHTTTTPAQAETVGAMPIDVFCVHSMVSAQLPQLPALGFSTEYDRDLRDGQKQALALGSDYQLPFGGRLYVRHELISSLNGPFALNTTQTQDATTMGVDTDYCGIGHIFSEYRVRDAFSGREADAEIGLRNSWKLAQGVRLNTSFEQVKQLSGTPANAQNLAVTGALEYTRNPLWKGTTSLEFRNSTGSDSVLSTIGLARKMDRNWTFLGRGVGNFENSKDAGTLDKTQQRVMLGVAYRQTDDDIWNGLLWYEFLNDRNLTTSTLPDHHLAHMLGMNLNYQPTPPLVLTGRYAIKFAHDSSGSAPTDATVQLFSLRVTRDITERWDAGLMGSLLLDSATENKWYGAGGEVGYLVHADLWLSAGYNVLGFTEADLAAGEFTERGPYIRLRYKFDETLFSGGDPRVNTTMTPTTGGR